MIPPSSLARLVLGYLEEEGLHRTAVTFQQECSDAQKDPFKQYSSLKTILEEYVEIKKRASHPDSDPGKVISSLWKKLDVIVSQLKYHTIPENKIPRVQHRTCRGRAFRNLKIAKPVPGQPQWPTLSKSHGRQEVVAVSNGNEPDIDPPSIDLTLSPSARNKPEFVESDGSLGQQPGNKPTKLSVDSSGHNVPISQLTLSCSPDHLQLQNSQTSTFPNYLRQDSFSSNQQSFLITAAQKSGSNALVCTCSDNHNSPVDASTINLDCTVEVVEECTSPLLRTNDDVLMQEISADKGHHSHVRSENDKVEIFSKSPKRKGQPPKKRNFSNPSPTKLVPVNPEHNASLENTFDLQQLLDGGNVDIDATMPLLLDTFLSTPLLQEKLAENINKVVCNTKQNETATDVISESSPMQTCEVEDAVAKQHDEPQVPVDDILNLMEADPAFDALFNLLSTDAMKTASPAKVPQAVPPCSYSGPLSSPSAATAGSSLAEPASTCTTTNTKPSTSSDNSLSATSVVTESLLLLAGSPYKGPLITTSTAPSLDNLHPISPKEVTPEFAHKQHKDDQAVDPHVSGRSVHALGGPGYVRSLQFQDQQPVMPVKKPKKSRPSKQKRDTSKTTSNKTGKRRSRKLNDNGKNSKTGEMLQASSATNTPGADAEKPEALSTIDVSAVKLLQSFTSLHSNADGNIGNRKDMGGKKSQGSSMVQLLQDAALNQQVQGVSTVNQNQTSASQCSSKKESIPGCSLQSSLTPTSSSISSLNGSKSIDHLNNSQQCIPPKLGSSAPLVGGRPLLSRPSIQSLFQAPPQSTPVLSSLPSVSSLPVSSSFAVALGKPSPSSSSSTSLTSSSPLYSLLSVPRKQLQQQQRPPPPLQLSSTYLQTPLPYAQQSSPPPLAHSQTIPTQSSSSSSHLKQSLPVSSYSQPPRPSSSYPPQSSLSSSSPLVHSQTIPTQSSSSSSHPKQSLPVSSYSQPPRSSSSYPPQSSSSSPPLVHSQTIPTQSASSSSHPKQSLPVSSYPQPPRPSSSYPPQSSLSSSASMSVNTPYYFSQAQHSHLNLSDPTTTTMQQSTNNHNPSINTQATRLITLAKSPSPAAMTTEFQGQLIQTSLDSSEPSPTLRNAEECGSGFISGFQGGLSPQSNNQESCLIAIKNTLSSASLDKDNHGIVEPKNGKNRKDNVHGIQNVIKQDKRKEIGGCGSVADEKGKGQKRPAGQDLKENKPKKSKGCKKTKKSKSKSLPKDFDVDKFLSKLHYVEK